MLSFFSYNSEFVSHIDLLPGDISAFIVEWMNSMDQGWITWISFQFCILVNITSNMD